MKLDSTGVKRALHRLLRSEIELQRQLNQSRIVARGIDAPEVAEVDGVDDLAGVRVNAR